MSNTLTGDERMQAMATAYMLIRDALKGMGATIEDAEVPYRHLKFLRFVCTYEEFRFQVLVDQPRKVGEVLP